MLHLKVKNDLPQENLCDFLILEEYFDRNIKLRLNEFDENGLKEAHDISTIITKIIALLNRKYNGNIPQIGILDGRKMIAKFIGLALFKIGPECLMKSGPNCGGIIGPCCAKHRLEGLMEAHEMFPKLFEPFGIKFDKIDSTSDTFFTSLLAIYIDFKTQIIVSDLILNSSNADGLSRRLENLLESFYGPAMNFGYMKTKLQQRAVDLRRILEQNAEDLKTALNSKFPADLFENNLKNILKNVYNSYPKTILSEKLTMTASTDSNIHKEEPREKEPNVKVAKPLETRNVNEVEPFKPLLVKTTLKNEPNPFGDVIISGKFFRGILEPVDERFAAIIEGRDVNVKQYLLQRKKRAASMPVTKKTKVTSVQDSSSMRLSLFDRHESAERISWDTQEPVDFTAKQSIKDPEAERIVLKTKKSSGGRRKFSDKEVANLIEGVRRFGRDWRRILSTFEFDDRSNVDLKDKARNLEKLGLL